MNLGAALVMAYLLTETLGDIGLFNGKTTTTTTYTTPTTSPPRPTCGIGEKAIYKADLNKWICVLKGFG